jgi:hypothetical protein
MANRKARKSKRRRKSSVLKSKGDRTDVWLLSEWRLDQLPQLVKKLRATDEVAVGVTSNTREEFAREMLTTVRVSRPKFSRNGAIGSSNGHRPWAWWKRKEGPSGAKHEDEKRDAQLRWK